ncbi:nicotinate-nucleotide adenylyltransferase [Thiovibrio sp. JS02]
MDLPEHIGRRVGILGGTFDPVHNGHLAVARAVREELKLDALLFVPASLPPHKLNYPISPFRHRLAMLALAIEGRQGFFLSAMEGKRLGPSYSIDTLRALRAALPADTELFFIIGMDAFAEITSWKQYPHLLDQAHFVVAGRPDQCPLSCRQSVAVNFPAYREDAASGVFRGPRPGTIIPLAFPPEAVSATQIRQRVARGEAIGDLVPAAVAEYIAGHRLYSA